MDGTEPLTFAKVARLRFVDFLLAQYGYINLSALMDFYAVSRPQASRDVGDYLLLAPANAVYDKKAKRYLATPDFKRVYP